MVVAKWEKRGWELIDHQPETVRTVLTFRRPRLRLPRRVVAIAAVVSALVAVVTIGALIADDDQPTRNASGAATADQTGADESPKEPTSDSSTQTKAAAEPSSGVTKNVQGPKDARYEDSAQLKDAAEAGGYDCIEWFESYSDWTVDSGECETGDRFSIYNGADDRDAWLRYSKASKPSSKVPSYNQSVLYALVGPNWIVQCQECSALQKILGGRIMQVD